MGLQIGIIGLPNVGKSTLFNALTNAQNAKVANYPFCTIEPNQAIVPVPDTRLDTLFSIVGVPRQIAATIDFVDIAGLVKGASQGEGLGNQFLGNIRNTEALVHVVRCFEDDNVVHISEYLDPVGDIEIVNTELMLADYEQLEKKIERLNRQIKGDRKFKPYLETAQGLLEHLNQGLPISRYPTQDLPAFQDLNKEMRFLTSKPVIFAANVHEGGVADNSQYVQAVREYAAQFDALVVKVCARLEEELTGMSDPDKLEFLALAGAAESALDQIIHTGYQMLGLISFFTMNEKEVRAWTIPAGMTAAQAAGTIHTDFERGFIRAEVIPFEVFDRYGGAAGARAAGEMQLEGREYVVQDGDVIYVRFNV